MIQPQDQAFYAELKAHLDEAAREAGGTQATAIPYIMSDNGRIDRDKTLEMPCYAGVTK